MREKTLSDFNCFPGADPMSQPSRKNLTNEGYWDAVWRAHRPLGHEPAGYLNDRIAELLEFYLPKDKTWAMEAGAGNSLWLPYMANKYGYFVVGVDYSETGCFLLKDNLRKQIKKALVVRGDVLKSCVRPGTADVVFSNGLIEHFTNYREVLESLKLWLKPNGILITLIPNKKYLFRHIERWIALPIYNTHMLLEPADLEKAYEDIGMDDVEAWFFGSFSTWKYTSKAKPLARFALRVFGKVLRLFVYGILRASHLKPESKTFSPLIVAVGRRRGHKV